MNAYVFKDSSRTYKISDLINELNSIEGLKRIRYTTSHPLDVSNDLIEAHKYCEKLMPLLHLPVQSGSSKILKSMNRKHNIEQYLKIIDLLSNAKPNIKFSSDFIISYPGENEEDFNQTINLVKKIKFINSFSFIFSARPGTPAAKLDVVNSEISKKRLIQLQQLLEQNNYEFKQSFLNQTTEVLVENKLQKNNQYFGRDRFLNPVIIESPKDITGKIINIQISKFNHNSLFGVIKNDKDFKEFAA